MDWRDDAIVGEVERRAGGAVRRRRRWSRVERWLRDRMRRPGAWLVLAALWLVVPAFFDSVGGAVWAGAVKWAGGCVYVGLAYHAVRRHVAFAPAVMMALGCGVSWLTAALMIGLWRAEAAGETWTGGWGLGLWMACAVLGGLVGLETLRDGSWWPVRLAGGAVAAGLVLWGGAGSMAAWALVGLAAGLAAWDAGRGRATAGATAASLGGIALAMAVWTVLGGAGVAAGPGGGVSERVAVGPGWAIWTSDWSGVTSVAAWWGEGVPAAVGWVAVGVAAVAWPVLAWGWWRWSRLTGDLLVMCCPWAALLVGGDATGRAVLLALLPMAWLSVWRLAMRYEKRRLTMMAAVVVVQAALTAVMLLNG
ncbi:MAG: hypothetical protein AAF078_03950 [Planctomycetota bacterium]